MWVWIYLSFVIRDLQHCSSRSRGQKHSAHKHYQNRDNLLNTSRLSKMNIQQCSSFQNGMRSFVVCENTTVEMCKAAGMLIISNLTWVQLVRRRMTDSVSLWSAVSSRCRISAWFVTCIRRFRSSPFLFLGRKWWVIRGERGEPDEHNGMAMLQCTCMWRAVSLSLPQSPSHVSSLNSYT